MFKKSSYNWSMSGLIFTALVGLVFLSSTAVANINDQVAQLDFDTATLDDIIDIFGEPVKYHWAGQNYTRDNLPNVYIVQYPNEFGIVMVNGHIDELRFESPAAGYLFQGQIQVGSSLGDVISVVGQPTQTIVGQPCGWQDGVLYKDINGTVGHCYYLRSDQNVRFFFWNYNVTALYLLGNSNSPPPTPEINEFDDVRSMDLSGHDLSGRNGLIETLTFNEETVWPGTGQMPGDCEPEELMTAAMNPGLGVRELHQQGITGAGVNVAIIDQPIYLDHPEYDGKIAAYYDTGCDGHGSSMHGPAVTSLLVGENCGTAPGANVYYAAAPSWKKDAAYYADALNWIIAQNETLPASEKIRIVSVSAAPSGPGSPFLYNNQLWDDAVVLAEAAGILILDCTNHHGFINRAWYDLDDPENVAKCTAGAPGYPPSNDPEGIHVPASCRTTAQHYDYHGRDSYIYWGRGGLSWSIPYCAGVLAMGWQIQPQLPADQMVDLLFDTAYINQAGAKIINPKEFISSLNNVEPREAVISEIEYALAEKAEILERIDAVLEKEWAAYEALEGMLESGDYGDLRKGNIVKAKQKIHSAIQHQDQSKRALEKSIKKLQDSLIVLRCEVETQSPAQPDSGAEQPVIRADTNEDGIIDFRDFAIMANHWVGPYNTQHE